MSASQVGETYRVELGAQDRLHARNAWLGAVESHPLVDSYKALLQSEATLGFVDKLLGLGGNVDLIIIPADYASVHCLVPASKLSRLEQCQLYLEFHQLPLRVPGLEETFSYSDPADKSLNRRVGATQGEEVIALVLPLTDSIKRHREQILDFSRYFLDERRSSTRRESCWLPYLLC
jgi:hypothetical protein